MSRVVGFYLKLDERLRGQRYITKGGALEEAKAYLRIGKARKVGVVRANDNILVMTISMNDKKEFVTDVK
jgi:hypothetical protein